MTSPRRRDGVLLNHAAALVLCAGTALCIATPGAHAAPRGEHVVRGQAFFDRNGNYTTIRTGRRTVINWGNFDIGAGETVRFIQPNSRSAVLNRVNSSDPTRIDGSLLANGRVYIVNQAGVVFGQGSVINVGALFAAAGQMSDNDFMAGRDHFTGVVGRVENHGMITTAEAASLIGERVANHGQIVSDGGSVAMVAGNDVLITDRGGQIYVRVDGSNLDASRRPTPVDPNNSAELSTTPGVENTGLIRSRGGNVTLGAGDTFSLAIRNSGTIDAAGGRVTAKASGGTVMNTGSISTSVEQGHAGRITLQGQNVVNAGSITADAESGAAGRVELTSTDATLLMDGSVTSASGGAGVAKGGELLVHSYNGNTSVADGAMVNISGGAAGGNGGTGEISAGENLSLQGTILGDSADGYKKASILFDPDFIFISSTGGNDGQVSGDGTVNFGDGGNGTFTISSGAIQGFNGNVRLEADFDITIDSDINKTNGGLTLLAGRDIIFGTSGGGDIDLGALTTDLSITARFLDFTAGRNFVDNVVNGTKLFSTLTDIRLTATTGHTDFGLATVPAGRTFFLTQAESMFFGAGPFGLVGTPTTTNCVVTITDGFLILGGDFGGVSGYQNMLSINASATEFLRVEDDLDIGTFANLRSAGDVQVRGFIHAGTTIDLHAGTDGTGNLLFQEAGLDFWANAITVEAGNNTGLGTALADLQTNDPIFRGVGGGATRPNFFTHRQDAAIGAADIADANQFGAAVAGMQYWIESNDQTVIVADGAKVDGTVLTLASQNGSFVNDDLELISLDVFGPGILNSNVQTSGDQTYHGTVRIGNDLLLTADDIFFRDTVDGTGDGTESLALAADVVFDGAVGGDHALENLNVARTARINGREITTFGDQRYNGAVTLGDDTKLFSLADGTIRFGSRVDSVGVARDLYVQTTEGGLIVFADDVGSNLELRDLELHTNGGGGNRSIAQRATIVGEDTFSIDCRNFVMGQNEKFTTLGSLDLNASQGAVLGDMVTMGNMFVDATTITLLRRGASTLLDGNGNTINDRGLDYVAGGAMAFNGTLVLGGIGGSPDPTFSDNNGNIPTLTGFGFEITRTPDAFVTLDALTFDGTVLDQRTRSSDGPPEPPPPNPGESDQLAAARPRDPLFRDSVIPEVYDLGLYRSLGMRGTPVTLDQAADGLDGRIIYSDMPGELDQFAGARDVTAARMDIQTLIALVERHQSLTGPEGDATLGAASVALNQSVDNYMSLTQAGAVDADAYRTYLEQTPSEAVTMAYVQDLRSLLNDLKSLPLTPPEFAQTRDTLLARVSNDGKLSPEQLNRLLESPAPAAEQAAPSAADASGKVNTSARMRDTSGRFVSLRGVRFPG